MDELTQKLNRRLSRIDMMKNKPGGDGSEAGEGGGMTQYGDVFDLKSADRDTLLELINICATSLPTGIYENDILLLISRISIYLVYTLIRYFQRHSCKAY